MDDLDAGPEPTSGPAVDPVDPATASAAGDPLPGARRRGRPLGSKDKAPRTPRQIQSAKDNLAAARAKAAGRQGPTDKQLEEAVAGLYAMSGMGVAFIDQEIGQAIAECSQQAAAAWVRLGQQNPAVRRVLVQMTTAGAAGELLTAHAPLVALVAMRISHRRLPPPPLEDQPTNGAYANGAPVFGTAYAG